MQWQGQEESSNVEDQRGMSGGGKVAVGGGAAVLLLILGLVTGIDFGPLARQAGKPGPAPQRRDGPAPDDHTRHFVGKVLASTEAVWDEQFRGLGKRYDKPKMVLFSNQVETGCGSAPSSVGPFYCPADRQVYLDPTFFDELEQKLGGSKAGFSQAYVIAHEVGHHVQNLLGYSGRDQQFARKEGKNPASVRLELQADYLAGAWAYHAQRSGKVVLDRGDLESALTTAKAIGDDRLQKRSRGWVSPESFTHGSSDQRIRAFRAGFDGGFKPEGVEQYFNPRTDPSKL